MSYVEKAFYRYIKSIFTTGFKVLFSRKYIFYTIAFILTTVTSTVFYLIEKQFTSVEIGDILINIELSVAVTYIVFGIFFSRYPLKFWAPPALITAAGGSALIYYLPIISPYIAGACYLIWIIVSVFLTFSFSRNFWGGKVLGSIMFLGKPDGEGTILFSGLAFVLTLINGAMGGYLLYVAIRETVDYFLIIAAAFVILALILITIVIFVLGKIDDVFYTILTFFYIFASFTLYKLTVYTVRGQPPNDNIGSMLVALFFIFYTVSNYGKKVKKIEEGALDLTILQEDKESRKRKEEDIIEEEENWVMLKVPRKIGPLGVLMSIMGLILGYHVTFLQIVSSTEDMFLGIITTDFDVNYLVGLKDRIAVILIPCMIIFFLISYRTSANFRSYSSPTLYRFEFLPPFEELVERIDRIKRGEDSWRDYANMIIKEGIKYGMKSTARKVIISPTKKVAGAIGGAYKRTKKGLGRIFRRRKDKKITEE